MDQRAVLLSHTSIRVLLPSLPPHTKPLPAVPTSITATLRYTSIVAPGIKGACQGGRLHPLVEMAAANHTTTL